MSRWRGCRRSGCWGCGGAALVLLAAAIGLGAIVVGRLGKADDRRVDQAEHPIAGSRGRVEIDLSYGRFRIEPVEVGRPLRVEADYDASAFELAESFRPAEAGGDGRGWSWTVRFGPRRGWFAALGHEARNTVRLQLPRGVSIRLVGAVETGRSELELGGLDLRAVDLVARTGEHEILFSRPLASIPETLRVVGNAGSIRVERLGNASPVAAEIEHRLGGLTLDLRGAWRGDARVEVRQQLGDLQVQAPAADTARFRVLRVEVSLGDREIPEGLLDAGDGERNGDGDGVAPLPTVSFDARVGFGNLAMHR